jgi:hypothetical protein
MEGILYMFLPAISSGYFHSLVAISTKAVTSYSLSQSSRYKIYTACFVLTATEESDSLEAALTCDKTGFEYKERV